MANSAPLGVKKGEEEEEEESGCLGDARGKQHLLYVQTTQPSF